MPAALPTVLDDGDAVVTDARMPERWLTDHRVQSLSDGGYRLFGNALMWCVANRTDGVILDHLLRMIPYADAGKAGELVESGVWRKRSDGWLIVDFDHTQTGADELDQLESIRRADRLKKQRQRAIKATEVDVPGKEAGHVPGTAQAGKDRDRKARTARTGEAVREGTSRAVPSQRPRPLPDNGWDD